jgi:ComF family protein
MGKALAASCPFQADVLVPVPLHWTRYAWRGFNQAEELAYGYAQNKKTRVVRAVKRIKRTKLQNNAQDRSTNVVGAFAATEVLENLKGKQILIVDDVLTSGATIAAVARIIMQAKPASIAAVVICRT